MTKEQQNIVWQCLPKEARKNVRGEYNKCVKAIEATPRNYIGDTKYRYLRDSLEYLFGQHNLISNEEPSELLFVEREKVQEYRLRYKPLCNDEDIAKGICHAIKYLFADKCLPDKELYQ